MDKHIHIISNKNTGEGQPSKGGHFHVVGTRKTTDSPDGPRHTHTLNGVKTSGPMAVTKMEIKGRRDGTIEYMTPGGQRLVKKFDGRYPPIPMSDVEWNTLRQLGVGATIDFT